MRNQWSYSTRKEAGEKLVDLLREQMSTGQYVVLAIPNGGVEVAAPIAKFLKAPLDIIIVRKLQIPYNPEAGFGALTSLGTMILNDVLVSSMNIDKETIERVRKTTENQIESRKQAYAGLTNHVNPTGKDVILVDDGLASGYTMMAAVMSVKEFGPTSITVVIPTAHQGSVDRVEPLVDRLACPRIERGFSFAVANAYQNWYDVPDVEVIEILKRFRQR